MAGRCRRARRRRPLGWRCGGGGGSRQAGARQGRAVCPQTARPADRPLPRLGRRRSADAGAGARGGRPSHGCVRLRSRQPDRGRAAAARAPPAPPRARAPPATTAVVDGGRQGASGALPFRCAWPLAGLWPPSSGRGPVRAGLGCARRAPAALGCAGACPPPALRTPHILPPGGGTAAGRTAPAIARTGGRSGPPLPPRARADHGAVTLH